MIGIGVSALLVACLGAILYAIVRYSIISPARSRGWKARLRDPDPTGIESIAGFEPPDALARFYREAHFVESTEFYLVDRWQGSPVTWEIGTFSPLTASDVREMSKVSGAPGIPIAHDMDMGVYYVDRGGAVRLRKAGGRDVEVAPDITAFAGFETGGREPEE